MKMYSKIFFFRSVSLCCLFALQEIGVCLGCPFNDVIKYWSYHNWTIQIFSNYMTETKLKYVVIEENTEMTNKKYKYNIVQESFPKHGITILRHAFIEGFWNNKETRNISSHCDRWAVKERILTAQEKSQISMCAYYMTIYLEIPKHSCRKLPDIINISIKSNRI